MATVEVKNAKFQKTASEGMHSPFEGGEEAMQSGSVGSSRSWT